MATPIGNLDDITLRALDVLTGADVVACEDSRVTRKLLSAHGIARPLVSYHEHNAERVRPRLLEALRDGKSVALVSDAGTPLISDPGFKLVRAAQEAGLPVTTVPWASAVLAALTLSGLPCERFFFAGFLPAKAAARRTALTELGAVPATLVVFESARRLTATLGDMAAVWGARPAALVREVTKVFEEVRRGTLEDLAEKVAREGPPKGEVVLVVGPREAEEEATDAELDARLRAELAGASVRDAVARVAAATGRSRREVYARALALTGRAGSPGAS